MKTSFHFLLQNEMISCIIALASAGVMELVDVVDSKSTASDGVPVRVRSPAPHRSKLFIACSDFFIRDNLFVRGDKCGIQKVASGQ